MIKILQVCPQKITGVEYHRLLIPHGKLNETGEFEITTAHVIDHQPDSFFENFDLIVTSSVVSKLGQQEILWKQLKRIGIPVIVDRDDTWILPHDHPIKQEWANKRTAEQIVYNLKHANAVMVTTYHLAQEVAMVRQTGNINVIPNAIDFDQPQFQPDSGVIKQKTDKVHIGWSGSVTHYHDIKMLAEPFMQLKTDPDTANKYRLILSGFVENDATWREYENIFTSGYSIDESAYCRINGIDAFSYASAYDMFDIGLIPLKNTPFNRCKSELKMLEMGAKGVAVIVSNQYPYSNIYEHGRNCLVADKKDWFKHIKKLIQNESMRKELSLKLQEDVRLKYNILDINQKRAELYKEVVRNGRV